MREKLDPGDPEHESQTVNYRRKEQVVQDVLVLGEAVIQNGERYDPKNIHGIDQQSSEQTKKDRLFQISGESHYEREEQDDHADRVATLYDSRSVSVINRQQNRQLAGALFNYSIIPEHVRYLIHVISNGSGHGGTLEHVALLLGLAQVKGINAK